MEELTDRIKNKSTKIIEQYENKLDVLRNTRFSLGSIIFQKRVAMGLSQKELADRIRVHIKSKFSASYLSMIENDDKTKHSSDGFYEAVSSILGINKDYLMHLGGKNDELINISEEDYKKIMKYLREEK